LAPQIVHKTGYPVGGTPLKKMGAVQGRAPFNCGQKKQNWFGGRKGFFGDQTAIHKKKESRPGPAEVGKANKGQLKNPRPLKALSPDVKGKN